MTDKELNAALKKSWSKARRKHLFPELPKPDLAEGEDRVALEIKSKKITINRNLVESLSHTMPVETVLEGLHDHGISHYTVCPWDFQTHLALYHEAKEVLKDKAIAQKATDYFIDVVADTHCFKEKDTPLPELYRRLPRGAMDEAIQALYQRIWGLNLNVSGYDEIARKLSRLPYLDRSRWRESIRKFSKIVQCLLEAEEEFGGLNEMSPMGGHGFDSYTLEEVDQGLKAFAKDSASPGEFKEVVKDFEEELKDMGYNEQTGMGLGPGNPFDADILYYMKLAENYSLPILKTPIEKSGSLYPHNHAPWEVGRPFRDIDPWTSFGKVMPGLTQIWEKKEGDTFGKEEGIPDCILVIDSSGSMTNPRQSLSYAVLGACCASDTYLRNNSKVAVYNFSDAKAGGSHLLDYSRKRSQIYKAICHYFGGGTKLNLEEIEYLQNGTLPDIFIITDMQITNLETLIDYLNQLENRVTAVHIGENEHVHRFRKSTALKKNINLFSVGRKEDIPRIVLGKIKEYFKAI